MPAAAQQQTDNLEELEMLLAGYRACAAEAIRFLTEEEQVPLDSPLILGLWRHLLVQEARLDVEGLLSSHGSEADDSGVNMSVDDSDIIYSSTSDAVLPTEDAQQSSGQLTATLDTRLSEVEASGTMETELHTNRTSDVSVEEATQSHSSVLLQCAPSVTVHTEIATPSPTATATASGTAG